MTKLSVAFEYDCASEADAIVMVNELLKQTFDFTNKGLVLATIHISVPVKNVSAE
jgi:hypothetical protein